MLRSLKLAGLTLGFIGITVVFLNLLGYFVYEERAAFRDHIRDVPGAIARVVPGFDGFMKRFPPPDGVEADGVTHIVKDVVQTHDQFPISITLRYLAGGERTEPETRFGWISWIVTAVGWLTFAVAELYSMVPSAPTPAPKPSSSA